MKTARSIIESYTGKPLRIMEVCGTHTHEIFRLGIRKILPENIVLISGPGCPVCVTPAGYIDEAIFLALEKKALICSFGDLIRVPGSEKSLAKARAEGGEIKTVYSPLDALETAEKNPDREVVFLAVGFETTVPGACLAVKKAAERNIKNFSILTSNKTMPKAYEALKGSADAFLFPGHVSVITGTEMYEDLRKEGVSGIVCGFTADEVLTAIATIVELSRKGEPFFRNCYTRVVTEKGNEAAVKLIYSVMEECDAKWRGLGVIASSGLQLKAQYSMFDARKRFAVPEMTNENNKGCQCGRVLKGEIKPCQCPLFGKACTPLNPVGACMVSNEGACSAYYQYGEN